MLYVYAWLADHNAKKKEFVLNKTGKRVESKEVVYVSCIICCRESNQMFHFITG